MVMTQLTDNLDRVVRLGTEAWERLRKEDRNWNDWMATGEALLVGRDWSMNEAGTDKPEGRGYNTIFSLWLKQHRLDDMHKTTRSRLFDVMINRPAIEAWRSTLTSEKRMEWNHPSTVLAHWKAATVVKTPRPGPTMRETIAEKDEEIAGLKEHVRDLEAARNSREFEAARPIADEPADVDDAKPATSDDVSLSKVTAKIASLPDKGARNLALAKIVIGAMKLDAPTPEAKRRVEARDRRRDGTDRPGDQRLDQEGEQDAQAAAQGQGQDRP